MIKEGWSGFDDDFEVLFLQIAAKDIIWHQWKENQLFTVTVLTLCVIFVARFAVTCSFGTTWHHPDLQMFPNRNPKQKIEQQKCFFGQKTGVLTPKKGPWIFAHAKLTVVWWDVHQMCPEVSFPVRFQRTFGKDTVLRILFLLSPDSLFARWGAHWRLSCASEFAPENPGNFVADQMRCSCSMLIHISVHFVSQKDHWLSFVTLSLPRIKRSKYCVIMCPLEESLIVTEGFLWMASFGCSLYAWPSLNSSCPDVSGAWSQWEQLWRRQRTCDLLKVSKRIVDNVLVVWNIRCGENVVK